MMRSVPVVLGALLAAQPACKHDSTDDNSSAAKTSEQQLEQAQKESESAYDRAKEAQEKARDKSEDAIKAQNEARDKQNEAAKAEQEAQQKSAEAQQAQQQARAEGEQAQQQAQAAQSRAEQLQNAQATEAQRANDQAIQAQRDTQGAGAGAAANPGFEARTATTQTRTGAQAAQMRTVQGTLLSVSAGEVVLQRDDAPSLRLKVVPLTQIHRGPSTLTALELDRGSRVTISYRMDGTQAIADHIEVQ